MTTILLTFRKLVKILRADTRPRQVALGVGLGILVGLPPFGIQGMLLLLLFCLISANLGAFLLAMGLAKAVGLALAGPLSGLGESLLYAEGQEDFWRGLLNLPVLNMLGLDRFLALGSTLSAIVLAAIVVPVAWKFTDPIRRGLEAGLSSGPLGRMAAKKPVAMVGRLLFGKRKESDPDKKTPWIRKGFLAPVALLLIVGVVSWTLFADTLVRSGAQVIGSALTGKEVEVRDAAFSALSGTLDLSQVVVDDRAGAKRGKVAEGQTFRFEVALGDLLDRHVTVGEATVNDFVWHATTEDAPPIPDDQIEGGADEGGEEGAEEDEGIDLQKILQWWQANEEQVRWAVSRLDGFFLGGGEPERGGPGYEGRAHYVYAKDPVPAVRVAKLGVEGLRFDWGTEDQGPLAALKRLDLTVEGLSSAPRLNDAPVFFRGAGDYGPGTIELEATFDARGRQDSTRKDLSLTLNSAQSSALAALGIPVARGTSLQIGMQSGEDGASVLRCAGSFEADNPGKVQFDYTSGAQRTLSATLTGLNPSGKSGWQSPDKVKMDGGSMDLQIELGLDGENLLGSLNLLTRDLRVSPGTMQQVLGLDASVFCEAVNTVAQSGALSLSFGLAGTRASPKLSMSDEASRALLSQLKQGLQDAGKAALLAQVDGQLQALQGQLGEALGNQLDGKLDGQIEKILPGGKELLEGAGKGVLEGTGKDVQEKAGGLIKGLLGGKKDKGKDG